MYDKNIVNEQIMLDVQQMTTAGNLHNIPKKLAKMYETSDN